MSVRKISSPNKTEIEFLNKLRSPIQSFCANMSSAISLLSPASVPDRPGVRVQTTGSEALVGAVEKGEQVPGPNHFRYTAPLLLTRVHS